MLSLAKTAYIHTPTTESEGKVAPLVQTGTQKRCEFPERTWGHFSSKIYESCKDKSKPTRRPPQPSLTTTLVSSYLELCHWPYSIRSLGKQKKAQILWRPWKGPKVDWDPWQGTWRGEKAVEGPDIHVDGAGNNSAFQVLHHPLLGSFTFISVQLLPHNRAHYQEHLCSL